MSQINRQSLKDRFKTGMRPTQADFENLMDSNINALEDGISLSATKNVGIGINTPNEKLQVNGAITIGDTANATPDTGTIKFDGAKFLGFAGAAWVDLGAAGGGDSFWTKPSAADLISFNKNSEGVEIKITPNLPSLSLNAINGSNAQEQFTILADGLSEATRIKGKRFWFSKQNEAVNLLEVNAEDDNIKMTTSAGEILNCTGDTMTITTLLVNDLTVASTFTPPPSDIRLKKNIAPFSEGLKVINNLNPVRFEYNGLAGTKDGQAHIGLIAQDLQKVLPELVEVHYKKLNESDAQTTALLYPKSQELIYAAINAIKELQQKVEDLENQVKLLHTSSNGVGV